MFGGGWRWVVVGGGAVGYWVHCTVLYCTVTLAVQGFGGAVGGVMWLGGLDAYLASVRSTTSSSGEPGNFLLVDDRRQSTS